MIFIHLAEGFEETEAVTVFDLLKRADLETVFVAVGNENAGSDRRMVKGAHGIVIKADMVFEEADYSDCSMIVLPGGMAGALNMQKHPGLIEKIQEFNIRGKRIAAICAAPMILGDLGILKGKNATIYPGMEEEMKGASPAKTPAVTDGNITTGRAPGAAIPFALEIIRICSGQAAAEQVREDLAF